MRLRQCALLVAFVLVGLAFVAPSIVLAQAETGRITGKVVDPQGGAVPGVQVTARSVSSGGSRTTVSDASGSYVIANLNAARYDVTFQLPGFKTITTNVNLTVGLAVTADIRLELGAVAETVSVVAVTPLI